MTKDLPSLLTAVRPSQRTDQYKVLSALYCLKSFSNPVTAKQIQDALELQLGSKGTPQNLNDRLRKYSKFVRVAEKGPPLRWSINEQGVKELATQSGIELTINPAENQYGVDIGIICALEQPEFVAVIEAAGGAACWRSTGDPRFAHVYRACELKTKLGKSLNVIGTTSTSMGLTAAAIATTQLIMQFRPRIVAMIGIAAGTHDGNKQFGDVLVADPSVDYNSGKVVREGGISAFLPDPYPIGLNPRLRSVLQKYRGSAVAFDSIREQWSGRKPSSSNRLHLGPLGAADQVIDDAERVIEIQKNWRKLIGVEMETYGVYRACFEAPDPKPRFVSFKSVCDFAAEKSDSWQSYAAYTAASFALDFFRAEWENLWPKI